MFTKKKEIVVEYKSPTFMEEQELRLNKIKALRELMEGYILFSPDGMLSEPKYVPIIADDINRAYIEEKIMKLIKEF